MRDLLEACDAGAVIVERGKDSWDDDVILRLAGEAVAGRIGDAASKLPNEVREQISGVAWTDVIALRIRVDHIYHRLDYAILWSTLAQDVPNLRAEIQDWLELNAD